MWNLRQHTIRNVAACVTTNDDDEVCFVMIVAATAAALKHHMRKSKQKRKKQLARCGLRREDKSSDIRLRRWLLLLPARSFERTESAGDRDDALAAAGGAVPVAGGLACESDAVREATWDEDGEDDVGATSELLDARI